LESEPGVAQFCQTEILDYFPPKKKKEDRDELKSVSPHLQTEIDDYLPTKRKREVKEVRKDQGEKNWTDFYQ
jgi:hypothetical protein